MQPHGRAAVEVLRLLDHTPVRGRDRIVLHTRAVFSPGLLTAVREFARQMLNTGLTVSKVRGLNFTYVFAVW